MDDENGEKEMSESAKVDDTLSEKRVPWRYNIVPRGTKNNATFKGTQYMLLQYIRV